MLRVPQAFDVTYVYCFGWWNAQFYSGLRGKGNVMFLIYLQLILVLISEHAPLF